MSIGKIFHSVILSNFVRKWYIKYHGMLARVTKTSILDPSYLYWMYYKRNLLIARKYLSSGVLLDVGCGNQDFADILGKKYIGLDYPATRSIHHSVPPAIYGDGYNIPIKSASVQSVALLQVLEHLSEPSRVISEIYRVLEPGGYLLLTAPMISQIHGEPYDFYRYTKYGITYLLQKSGFEIVEVLENGSFYALMGLMSNIYLFHHFFEVDRRYFVKVILGMLKVLFTPFVLLTIVLINILCVILDITHRDHAFTSNYTFIAKRSLTRQYNCTDRA